MRIRINPKWIGVTAYFLGKLLLKSQRVKMVFHPNFNVDIKGVFGFWHDKHLAPTMLFAQYTHREKVVLVSPSYDGQIIGTWLSCLGYKVIKGSSNKKPRESLVKLIEVAKSGACIGIAADGPRGPRYQAKSGMAFISKKSELPIIPVGVAFSSRWVLKKSWDQFQFPLPFSKIIFYVGEPFTVTHLDCGEAANVKISEAIAEADKQAQSLLSS